MTAWLSACAVLFFVVVVVVVFFVFLLLFFLLFFFFFFCFLCRLDYLCSFPVWCLEKDAEFDCIVS